MKKRYFLIGTIVIIGFAAAVMSCDPLKKEASGCTCKVVYNKTTVEETWSNADIEKHKMKIKKPEITCQNLEVFLVTSEKAKSASCEVYYVRY